MMCYETSTTQQSIKAVLDKEGIFEVWFRNIQLLPGHYMVDFEVFTKSGELITHVKGASHFEIVTRTNERGMYRMEHEWIIS